ncbi:MAG: hypothetical protein M1813_001235 [Trichoglossum hirsutum]|jgi:hypothetical protein|nr:MAG: hypothetical protein M1813_001235 [Trichoglossum hirsutum]
MLFTKTTLAVLLALALGAHAAHVRIGYAVFNVPNSKAKHGSKHSAGKRQGLNDLPGLSPTCTPLGKIYDDNWNVIATPAPGASKIDGCPAADKALFCGRWGACPNDILNSDKYGLRVLRDNSSDRSIQVLLYDTAGRKMEATCPWHTDIPKEESSVGTWYATWQCEFPGL